MHLQHRVSFFFWTSRNTVYIERQSNWIITNLGYFSTFGSDCLSGKISKKIRPKKNQYIQQIVAPMYIKCLENTSQMLLGLVLVNLEHVAVVFWTSKWITTEVNRLGSIFHITFLRFWFFQNQKIAFKKKFNKFNAKIIRIRFVLLLSLCNSVLLRCPLSDKI